ncbi:MAG TPA: pyrroline-5-carboxylate reductase [bacterium]|nr:pyrroline-5-carboxylate reductase [bacterium]
MKVRQKTVVFGIGAMGSALVKGWISSKMIAPSLITAVDVDAAKLKKMASQLKVKATPDAAKALKDAGLILLAVKPQQMKELLAQAGQEFPKKALVVSIAAGVSTQQIEKGLPQGCPVVRVMPNTPALLGAGMAAVAGGSRAKDSQVKMVLDLFSAVGRAVKVTEGQMDLVTAVSGSGPAYIFHMVEAMTEAAVKGGLSPEVAHLLVAQTVYGAARMVLETGKSPEELRIQVTSPGGTTQAALTKMGEKGFKETVQAAVEAATQRGAELRQMSS